MIVRITSKRQITLPARVLKALGVGPGDRLEIREAPEGLIRRPRRVDLSRLAPLRSRLRRGVGKFDIAAFREQPYDPVLRD